MTIRNSTGYLHPGVSGSALAALISAVMAFQTWNVGAFPAPPPVPVAVLTDAERLELESALSARAYMIVQKQERMDGQGSIGVPVVRFADRGGRLVVDLGAGYVPSINGGELEDHLMEIANTLTFQLESLVPVKGVRFLFDGHDIFHYFPDDWRPIPPQRAPKVGLDGRPQATRVLISAGHGLYYHRTYKDWRPARAESYGVTEDFITPLMASDLATYLNAYSDATTMQVRSEEQSIHAESNQSWWKVSARYYLKERYPDQVDIWNSKGEQDYPLVERDEDIYSRPLYANYLGVEALLQVHTNAADPAVRGARVYHQPGRAEDAKLASSILFYMKESIHAQPGFEEYPVAATPHEANLAENREAKMLSVIAEVGFHTNAEDAAAIADPQFRKAAMRGMEKGYRMYLRGATPEAFAIVDHPDITLKRGESGHLSAPFKGNPTFPVLRVTKALQCPAGWKCTGGTQSLTETASPFVTKAGCASSNPGEGTILWEVEFTDAYGLKSTAQFNMHCTL